MKYIKLIKSDEFVTLRDNVESSVLFNASNLKTFFFDKNKKIENPKATIITTQKNQRVYIGSGVSNDNTFGLGNSFLSVIIDGTAINLTDYGSDSQYFDENTNAFYYTFETKGKHTIEYILMDNTLKEGSFVYIGCYYTDYDEDEGYFLDTVIEIPSNITLIENFAIPTNCRINFDGTIGQWEDIEKYNMASWVDITINCIGGSTTLKPIIA